MQVLDPATGKLRKRAVFADWIGRYALPPLTLATGVAGAFLTYDFKEAATNHPGAASFYHLVESWIGLAFFVLAFASFGAATMQGLLRPALRKLQGKVDLIGENFRTLCDGLMSDLASKLAIIPGDPTRVSLYLHNGDSSFVLIGRYSSTPALRKPGRPSYPDNQGCIARGWQFGWHFENALGTGDEYFENTEDRYGMDRVTVEGLAMQPLLFGVHRVDHGTEFLATIVVESMRVDRFIEDALRADLEQVARDIAPTLMSFRSYAPVPSVASSAGF